MSDVSSKPFSKHQIDAHIWIGAFAIAQIVITLVLLNRIDLITDVLGVSGQVNQKLTGEVATMQQEIAALRQTPNPSKAEPKRGEPASPARSEPGNPAAHGRAKN